jgi:leader peptidase (prepilin peptidase)/N-methyltransferase
MAAGYAYLWIALGPSVKLVFYAVYLAVLALILVTDVERRLILNVVTYPAILFAIAAGFFTPDMRGWSALAGGAVGFSFFLVAALVGSALFGSGALGGGDVKLAAFVGLITGFPLVIGALLLTIVTGAVVSLFLLVTRMRSLRDPIPYGPFLVIGGVVTLLWGYQIMDWLIY